MIIVLLQKSIVPENPFEYGLVGFFLLLFAGILYLMWKAYDKRMLEDVEQKKAELEQKQNELKYHQKVGEDYRVFLQNSNVQLSKVIEGNTAAFQSYNKVLTELAAQIKVQNEILRRKWFYLNFKEDERNPNKGR